MVTRRYDWLEEAAIAEDAGRSLPLGTEVVEKERDYACTYDPCNGPLPTRLIIRPLALVTHLVDSRWHQLTVAQAQIAG